MTFCFYPVFLSILEIVESLRDIFLDQEVYLQEWTHLSLLEFLSQSLTVQPRLLSDLRFSCLSMCHCAQFCSPLLQLVIGFYIVSDCSFSFQANLHILSLYISKNYIDVLIQSLQLVDFNYVFEKYCFSYCVHCARQLFGNPQDCLAFSYQLFPPPSLLPLNNCSKNKLDQYIT